MNSLTDEQRRRIEDNRRKAMELRATKNEDRSTVLPTISNSKPVLQQQAPPQTQRPVTAPAAGSKPFENRSNTATGIGTNLNRTINIPNNVTTIKLIQPPPKLAPPAYMSKPIAGVASLISRDRFKVELTYHQQAITIFKSMPGAQYDPSTKVWNFPLSEHAKLMSSMECLKPSVGVGWIPSYVINVFKNSPKNLENPDLSQIDPVLVRALMPFQKDGVIFGIRKNGRALIADDMGLGKTIQALGIAHYYYNEWPLLIVAPSSMRYRWRECIWEWLPSVPAVSISIIESSKDQFLSSKVVIVSYDLLQKRQKELSGFKVVIIDESHHLKNIKTARTKAALPILQKAKRALLLSGTPALSRPMELYPQLSAVCRVMLSYADFGIRYCNGKKSNYGWDYSGSSNMQELNLVLEETVMIRRLKSDVLKQLPPKLRKLVILDPAQIKLSSASLRATARAFNEAKTSRIGEGEKRRRLLEYYSESAKVKLPAVNAYIRDLVESEKKFLVFAHHKAVMNGICEYLEEVKCKYIRIDGNCSSEDRQFCCDQFQSRADIRVAVLSILAANSGLTLTAAGLVIFAELYWNPGILTQAEDRAHRIGQEDSVIVEYLLAKGTSDDILWPLVQDKLEVLNKAGLSKDTFQDAEAIGHIINAKDLMDTSNMASQSLKSQKHIQDYFSQTERKEASSTNNIYDDENVFETSAEDDAILMQLMNDF